MSLYVYVQYFLDGKPAVVPAERICDIFKPYIVKEISDGVYEVFYDKLNCSYLSFNNVNDGNVRGFCINRPCADEQLWKCMYECLSLGNCVIICPGLKGMLTNNLNIRNHVPRDMIESIGLRVVKDYEEFMSVLNER